MFGGFKFERVRVDNRDLDISGAASFLVPYAGVRAQRLADTTSTLAELTVLGRFTDASPEQLDALGRFDADDSAIVLQFQFSQSIFLEPLLFPARFRAAQTSLAHEVVATEEGLREALFGPRPAAEALLAEVDGECAGFALFFHNFSTFLGRRGLYLEDLFVRPRFRGQGLGKALMVRLARIALERGCGRFEWWVLDWNAPSIAFYRSLGAVGMDEWTVQRVSGEALQRLANQAD